ncbi:MAG: DUF4956 domain-containing protein [Deltaproteobacteria bacterium]|nr:DUF4956 domain-containing protein [Deltaproteobacteria bacterium]
MNLLEQLSKPGAAGLISAVLAIGLAFALAQMVSAVYVATFRGLSYSRSFVQGIPLGAVVTSMLMLAIGDSIAAGIGLAGGLSIVRFRTTMRDPRDMVFIFAGLGVGIACGLQAYPAAISGTVMFCLAAFLLFGIHYGARKQFDGLVRFVASADSEVAEKVTAALRAHTAHFVLVSMREAAQGDAFEHAYQIRIPDPDKRPALLHALDAIEGTSDVALHMQEPTLEV